MENNYISNESRNRYEQCMESQITIGSKPVSNFACGLGNDIYPIIFHCETEEQLEQVCKEVKISIHSYKPISKIYDFTVNKEWTEKDIIHHIVRNIAHGLGPLHKPDVRMDQNFLDPKIVQDAIDVLKITFSKTYKLMGFMYAFDICKMKLEGKFLYFDQKKSLASTKNWKIISEIKQRKGMDAHIFNQVVEIYFVII